jgi:sulfatase-like protein
VPLFLILRTAVTAFVLATAAYGMVSASPFAYDMFIRPRMLPWLNDFVAWHHAWYLAAYALGVASLARDLDWRESRRGARRAAGWLAAAFVVVFGAVGVRLLFSPYLPSLSNDRRGLAAAAVSFVPLLWLALIDHLSAGHVVASDRADAVTGSRRLLFTCAATAAYTWVLHTGHALATLSDERALLWIVTTAWTLALTAAAFTILFAVLSLTASIAHALRARRRWEYAFDAGVVAVGLGALLERLVLPSISIGAADARWLSVAGGLALGASWSGVSLRRAAAGGEPAATGLDLLLASVRRRGAAAAGLALLPVAVIAALRGVERFDWDFLIERLIVVCEWVLVFALMLRIGRRAGDDERPPSNTPLLLAAVVSIAALAAVPRAALWLAQASGDHQLEPSLSLERGAATEIAFTLLAGGLVRSAEFDADYFRRVQTHVAPGGAIAIPSIDFAAGRAAPASRPPDIFMFVVDSLRRDYLSPYNDAVTFTPRIAELARESFVFRNAFTRYGGTELGMPSIWVGGTVMRGVLRPGFERINALEKLVNADGYRVAINDYVVEPLLKASTPVTAIDREVLSADADLCHNLASLEANIEAERADARPLFAFFAPMNVHLINTRRGGRPAAADADYRGFYSPYAARLKRIDVCVGEFVGYLKAHRRYDNAIIVITSDHGDSLGEGNNWGHAFWLFPEDVRIPLIVRVPPARAAGLTTDLSRLAFSTDIAPTLYALLDYRVADLGPLFGAPLLVRSDAALPERRHDTPLLTSSYAPTVGLLRRNGRLLFVSDLFEKKEFAFDLSAGVPIGARVVIDGATRELNHRLIRERLDAVEQLYRATPAPGGR